jgi:hypothetical protein
MTDALSLDQAEYAMRNWSHPQPGRIRIGSPQHLQMFCQMLLDTHNPYKPAVIAWPPLLPEALHRVTSLPIWDMAIQKEGCASASVDAFARTVDHPLLRRALDMDAGEEQRHKVVLSKLVAAYGIEVEPEPDYPAPKDPEWGWLAIGYGECFDSFFASGLFGRDDRSMSRGRRAANGGIRFAPAAAEHRAASRENGATVSACNFNCDAVAVAKSSSSRTP